MITLDLSHARLNEDIYKFQGDIERIHDLLIHREGKGNEFTGWFDWTKSFPTTELNRIQTVAENIRKKCEVFIVCGIGGSYLGTRAAIEMINGLYSNKKIEVVYMGNTFSANYIAQTLAAIKDKELCVNVISKSGTTTETAMAFRFIKQLMVSKYGKEEASERIFATSDAHVGTLKQMSDHEQYETFVIPDSIGGRYSVITPVGLLPMAVAGIDIDALLKGYAQAKQALSSSSLKENEAYQYAVARRILQKQGKDIEMFVTYEPQLNMLGEWWKQLFGESEGKEGKGIFPSSATYSTDLHSLGQFVQEGKKILFETLLLIDKPNTDILFPKDDENLDQMNYLAGKSVDWVNKMAMEGTLEAHEKTGNVPNIILHMEKMNAEAFGYACYFFFLSCATTCYLLDINPFNQPGVEVYKKNMFRLLGK